MVERGEIRKAEIRERKTAQCGTLGKDSVASTWRQRRQLLLRTRTPKILLVALDRWMWQWRPGGADAEVGAGADADGGDSRAGFDTDPDPLNHRTFCAWSGRSTC